MTSATSHGHQEALAEGAGSLRLLCTIASSDGGGGSMRGTSINSGASPGA
jgi:hypothetical protein